MKLLLVFLLITFSFSYSSELKLTSKTIRKDSFYEIYPLKDFLIFYTEYRKDRYIVVVDKNFNSKVNFTSLYLREISQIGDKVYGVLGNRDLICFYQIYPEFKEIYCLDRNYVEKNLLKATEYRETLIYKTTVTENLNLAFLLKPRKAHNITEFFFGKGKYKGRIVVLNMEKKKVFEKRLSDLYKKIILTEKGIYALKDNKLIFIDFKGNQRVLLKGVKSIDKFRYITSSTYDGLMVILNPDKTIAFDKNCYLKDSYVICDKKVYDLIKGDIFTLPELNSLNYEFICRIDNKLIYRKDWNTFYITDINGKYLDSFEGGKSINCINEVLISEEDKKIKLYKIVEK